MIYAFLSYISFISLYLFLFLSFLVMIHGFGASLLV